MKKGLLLISIMGCMLALPIAVQAGEISVLLDKLVEKNILTPLEAQIIADETKQEVAKEVVEGKSYALPKWVQNIKLKGDFRLRYQYERDQTDSDARSRGRIRYRLGVESKVADVKVGAGIASGGDDPRSTNQSFQDTFETGDVRLDYAYAEYSPSFIDGLDVIGGKFKRKKWLWNTTDMLWDGDINPSGASFRYEKGEVLENTDAFVNTGVWLLDDNGHADKADPFLVYVQGGAKWKDSDGKVDAKAAVTHYGFQSVKGTDLDWCAGTNTGVTKGSSGDCSGGRMYDFDSVSVSAEVGVKEPLGGLPLDIDERVALFSDYIHNVDPDDNNNGWALGAKFGNKKIKKRGQWQIKYQFVNLQADAWPDVFPDSDRLGGATNARSHEAIFNYGLRKNVTLGIDYYNSRKVSGVKDTDHLVQADLVVKF